MLCLLLKYWRELVAHGKAQCSFVRYSVAVSENPPGGPLLQSAMWRWCVHTEWPVRPFVVREDEYLIKVNVKYWTTFNCAETASCVIRCIEKILLLKLSNCDDEKK